MNLLFGLYFSNCNDYVLVFPLQTTNNKKDNSLKGVSSDDPYEALEPLINQAPIVYESKKPFGTVMTVLFPRSAASRLPYI